MSVQRKRYSSEEKSKVAVEAIKRQKTTNELAAENGVHPTQITQWKSKRWMKHLVASLYQEIGQLKMV